LAQAYEGSISYEDLKRYPPREIELLTQTINKIRTENQSQIDKSHGKQSVRPENFPKIGL
jgi:hypothetical protein